MSDTVVWQENFSSFFFVPLQQHNIEARAAATAAVIAELRGNDELARVQHRNIFRLTTQCPFADVRKALGDFLEELHKGKGWPMLKDHGVSAIFNTTVEPLSSVTGPPLRLYEEIFVASGRVSNIERILAWHPVYLESFWSLRNLVMRQPGPLPFEWRNYIAIMAASQYDSQCIVDIEAEQFLINGGDANWLKGLAHAPARLRGLERLNNMMAQQPWMLNKLVIGDLVKSGDWSMAEVVHAIVLMSQYHNIAAFAKGSGILPEPDFTPNDFAPEMVHIDAPSKDDEAGNTLRLEALLSALSSPRSETREDPTGGDGAEAPNQVDLFLNMEDGQSSNATSPTASTKPLGAAGSPVVSAATTPTTTSATASPAPGRRETLTLPGKSPASGGRRVNKYALDTELVYEDFDIRKKSGKKYDVFRAHDYSWSEHGYSLMAQYYDEAAPVLDKMFSDTFNLTYNEINGKWADTLPLRRSVWYYIHRLMGVFHDDYDYHEPNQFLNISLKTFIKKVTCTPTGVTLRDIISMGLALSPQEKVHVLFLALEARKQASLLYALHAVMKHMMPE